MCVPFVPGHSRILLRCGKMSQREMSEGPRFRDDAGVVFLEHRVVDGLGMLLFQARPGFRLWFGREPEVTDDLRRIVLEAAA